MPSGTCSWASGPSTDLGDANTAAVSWCAEVNGRLHSETVAVPDERLAIERTLLGALPSVAPGHRGRRDPHRRPAAHGPLRLGAIQRARARSSAQQVEVARRGSRARHPPSRHRDRPPSPRGTRASSPSTTPTMAVRRGSPPGRCDHGHPPSWPSSRSARWPRPSCAPLPRRERRSCPPSWRSSPSSSGPTAARPSSRPSSGPSPTAASGPPTSGPSSRPVLGSAGHGPPVRTLDRTAGGAGATPRGLCPRGWPR